MLTIVRDQSEFDQLVKGVDWDDAFIKESYYICSANVISETVGVLNGESPGVLRVLTLTPHRECPGVVFHFTGVTQVSLPTGTELNPHADVRSWKVEFSFSESTTGDDLIIANTLQIKMLGLECWDPEFRIGVEEIRSEIVRH